VHIVESDLIRMRTRLRAVDSRADGWAALMPSEEENELLVRYTPAWIAEYILAGDRGPAPATDFRRPADPIVLDRLQRHPVCAHQLSRLPDRAAVRRPSWPLVAMITVVAASTITALKMRNLAVFDPGMTSSESWLIAASWHGRSPPAAR
jgi:hypothetical protein